jgi:hypothetical protein
VRAGPPLESARLAGLRLGDVVIATDSARLPRGPRRLEVRPWWVGGAAAATAWGRGEVAGWVSHSGTPLLEVVTDAGQIERLVARGPRSRDATTVRAALGRLSALSVFL